MEKLYEIHAEGRYDLLVLDTPPSRNALDFLDAPNRLLQFIDGRALQVFMKPTGFGMRIFGRGASMMFSVLRRITGVDLLEDLAEFFQAFSGMVGGFRERARKVNELLADPATSFLVVCAPQGEPISEAVYFHRKLEEARMPFGGVIVNKVHAAGRRGRRAGRRRARRAARRRGARRPGRGQPPRLPHARRARPSQHRAPRRRARHRRRDRGPLPRPRRPRPRRPDRDQPLPVRLRRRGTRRDRGRGLSPERPKPPGVRPGGSTCSSWGDRRKSWVTAARRRRDGCGRR